LRDRFSILEQVLLPDLIDTFTQSLKRLGLDSKTWLIKRITGHPFQSNAVQILYFFKAADTASSTLHWALRKWHKAKAIVLLLKQAFE
jgi:hypothetical protein